MEPVFILVAVVIGLLADVFLGTRLGRARGRGMQRVRELGALLAPGGELRAPLGVLALEAAARLLGVPQLRLVARHLRAGGIQRALGRVHRVAGGVVRGAGALDARLHAPELRGLGFQRVPRPRDLLRVPVALGRGVAPAQEPQQVLLDRKSTRLNSSH